MARKPYPSDVSDDEWMFVAPYLILMRDDAPQRTHPLRELFDGLRWIVHTGSPWRYLPHDFPPWHAVYQQARRWMNTHRFLQITDDLRQLLRKLQGRDPDPTAVILDSRTLRSTPESGARAGYDGNKKKNGSKLHLAVDTLGHLLALSVTPASEDDRRQVGELARQVQEATDPHVKVAFVDQGYTGENAAESVEKHGIELVVVKRPYAKRGFVLLPKRWIVERSFAWASRFRRLVKDDERLPQTLAGLHIAAFIALMLTQLVRLQGSA